MTTNSLSHFSSPNHLALIAQVNEDIKRVVRLARNINLLALNAILMSRRAGKVAVGFGVIADELRIFSKSLTHTMQTLMSMSYNTVQTVSHHQRNARMNKLMLLATNQISHSQLKLNSKMSESKTNDLRSELQKTYQQLSKLVIEAEDSSRFGSVIARSLKIEATYGSDFSNLLTQIAMEFGRYIDAIPEILTRLEFRLKSQK